MSIIWVFFLLGQLYGSFSFRVLKEEDEILEKRMEERVTSRGIFTVQCNAIERKFHELDEFYQLLIDQHLEQMNVEEFF